MENKKLINLGTYIEASSLKAFLEEAGITCSIPEKYTAGSILGEPEIRYGGISAINPGIDIYVKEEEFEKANFELEQWKKHIKEINAEEPISKEIPIENYFKYFGAASFFSLMFPVILILLATWYLIKLILGKPKHYPKTFWISLLIYFTSFILHIYFGWENLKEFIL